MASPIEDSARDERDRASARAGRQTVDVATSRLTRARRGVRRETRAREFKPAALGASGHSLISVGCKKQPPPTGYRGRTRKNGHFVGPSTRVSVLDWCPEVDASSTPRGRARGATRSPRTSPNDPPIWDGYDVRGLSHDHDAQQRLARLAGRGDPGRIRPTAADGEVLGGLRGLEGTRPKP